LVRTPGLEPG